MQADVVEAAQGVVVAKDDDGVVLHRGSEELSVLAHLLRAPDELPGVREDALALELEVDGIIVEPRRDGGGALDVRVEGEDEGQETGGREVGESGGRGLVRGGLSMIILTDGRFPTS